MTDTSVAPEFRIEEFPEVKSLAERLNAAEGLGVTNPYFLVNDGVTRDTSMIGGENAPEQFFRALRPVLRPHAEGAGHHRLGA